MIVKQVLLVHASGKFTENSMETMHTNVNVYRVKKLRMGVFQDERQPGKPRNHTR